MQITAWHQAEAVEGMYHFPTEENRDARRYCDACAHGEPVRSAGKSDHRKRARCAKKAEHLRDLGRKGAPAIIPAETPGCKYWAKR